MHKHVRILIAGALVIAPLAATGWLAVKIGMALGALGYNLVAGVGLIERLGDAAEPFAGAIGVVIMLVAVYLVGLVANFWIFGRFLRWLDRLMSSLPGIKTVYESVRDLLKLFGGNAGAMGRVVLYTPPGKDMRMLGIVTNENPPGRPEGDDSVMLYVPLGYMIGGPVFFASPDHLQPLDMPVETALKLSATAFVGMAEERTKGPEGLSEEEGP